MRFMGVHGALAEERERPQPFEVDLDVHIDLRPAGADDRLSSTVDYGRLCEVAREVVEGPHIDLLEHMAELIAAGALALAQGRAQQVVVTVRKLRPPVPVQMSSAAVTIWRP
jgi:dihydroneopterin aldolase